MIIALENMSIFCSYYCFVKKNKIKKPAKSDLHPLILNSQRSEKQKAV